MGRECLINNGVHIYTGFYNDSEVIIGNKVAIGLDSCITTNSHTIGPSNHRWGDNTSQTVVIEDGVWVGANVTILPGVTIGRGGNRRGSGCYQVNGGGFDVCRSAC